MHTVAGPVLPQFVDLGKRKIAKLVRILEAHTVSCSNVLLLYDENTMGVGGQEITAALKKADIAVSDHIVQNSDEINVARVGKAIIRKQYDLVIGFGGGKVLDVAKLAAGKNNKRFISIPTTLSNDGLASPVAVIKNRKGIPISHITKPPYGVIIDIDVGKGAPIRHLMAGIGDLISNLSAVFDARLGQARNAEVVDERALELAEIGGIRLLQMRAKDINSSAFLRDLAQGLIKSGLAMCISGTSRPASGSEHKISHSIDHYFSPGKGLHGEQVGIAAIFTMYLQKNKYLEPMRKFYRKIGFPDKLRYLDFSHDEFVVAVMNATRIRPERYTILEDMKPTAEQIRRALKLIRL